MSSKAPKPRVLCVDDEPDLLKGIKLQLRKTAVVETADSGQAGLEILESQEAFDVVISDMRMPEMDGAAFLTEVRKRWPTTQRILLTGQADIESTVAAVNEGGISTFLTKPCSKERLIEEIEAAVEIGRLRHIEQELIEGTLRGALGILSEILGIVSPAALQRSTRIESIVQQMSMLLELEEGWRFQIAATLSQIGCVSVPLDILDAIALDQPLEESQADAYRRHPQIAFDLVSRIPRLEEVAEMIRGQLVETEIDPCTAPAAWGMEKVGAELLRIAGALDRRLSRGESLKAAITSLQKEAGHPNCLLEALDELDLSPGGERERVYVSVGELAVGMTLDQDLESLEGVFVAKSGTRITPMLLERFRNFAANARIKEPIAVWVEREEAEEEGHSR